MDIEEKNQEQTAEQKEKSRKAALEFVVVVMLGMTAILTAWATWLGSLHSGNQSTNYTLSNNLAAEGNSEYNMAVQQYMQDTLVYNDVYSLMIDKYFAMERNDQEELEVLDWKIDELKYTIMQVELSDALDWAIEESTRLGYTVTPFHKEGFVDAYYEEGHKLLRQSDEALAQGKVDNANADAFGLVTVIYAVVLFLLGIVGTLAGYKNRVFVVAVAGVALVIATAYMFTIPFPTGFSILSFFPGS